MDNRHIDITSEGTEALAMALRLIWPNAPGGKASHYKIGTYRQHTEYYQDTHDKVTSHSNRIVPDEKGTPTFILYWGDERDSLPLPFPHDLNAAINLIQDWLKEVSYGREPDHDGDNREGWRVFNEAWGHVAGSSYAIAAIQPAWAMYGK